MGRAQVENRDEFLRNTIMAVAGLNSDISTGTCSSDAVEINDHFGMVTTEDKTTAQNGIVTITVTNNKVTAASIVLVAAFSGGNTQGTLMVGEVKPGAGSFTVKLINKHATSEAFNGSLKFAFAVIGAL